MNASSGAAVQADMKSEEPLHQRIRDFLDAAGQRLAGNDRPIEKALILLGEAQLALEAAEPSAQETAARNAFAARFHSLEKRVEKLERDLTALHRDTIG